jgi:hypothetical protein
MPRLFYTLAILTVLSSSIGFTADILGVFSAFFDFSESPGKFWWVGGAFVIGLLFALIGVIFILIYDYNLPILAQQLHLPSLLSMIGIASVFLVTVSSIIHPTEPIQAGETTVTATPTLTPTPMPTPQVVLLHARNRAEGQRRGQSEAAEEPVFTTPIPRRYRNVSSQQTITDPYVPISIPFNLDNLDGKLITTGTGGHMDAPHIYRFENDTPLPTDAFWVVMNARNTRRGRDDHPPEPFALVRAVFQGEDTYEQEFLLTPDQLVDWRIANSTLATVMPTPTITDAFTSTRRTAVQVLKLDGDQFAEGELAASQLLALRFEVDAPDPLTAIIIEDRSLLRKDKPASDPAIDIAAIAIIEAVTPMATSSLPKVTEIPVTEPSTPASEPQKGIYPLCRQPEFDITSVAASTGYLDNVIRGNYPTHCGAAPQPNMPFIFLRNPYATLPTRETITQATEQGIAVEDILSSVSFNLRKPRPAHALHLAFSAHNLCLLPSHQLGKEQIARISITFTDGYKLPDIPLIAGKTVPQSLQPVQPCANGIIASANYAQPDSDILAQYGVSRKAHISGRSGEVNWFEESADTTMYIEHYVIEIPEALRQRPIQSIQVIDESTIGRGDDLERLRDPFLVIYGISLEEAVE